ncbi:MAG: right-handed parallel beta-helix repeat-containing protein [Candidatus Sumerlaeia bacterium]|nr:right-handed parallel beta-helix repeat-containing protein [Candidatus Sumerlaeia bacterium]
MKRKTLKVNASVALAVAMMAVAVHSSADPVELVQNGSFEQPQDPTFGPPAEFWQEEPPGAPFPSAVNYPWLASSGVWDLNGDNPDGDQVGVLAGNAAQTVGTIEADKLYTFSYWVYFRSPQPFNGELSTALWTGDLYSSNTDGVGSVTNLPNPLPIDEWFEVTTTINTAFPAFSGFVDEDLIVHFYSTGDFSEILLDNVSLTVQDAPPLEPVNYYVSASEGDDANDGLTPGTAWESFDPLSSMTLAPATTVHLRRGDIWLNSQLVLTGKGTTNDLIRLTAFGEGPNPIITGINDIDQPAVIINNPSHWEIDSLDLREAKVGIFLRFTGGDTDGSGPMFNNENITITHCHFQDINHEWSDVNGQIEVLEPFEISWGSGIWVGGNVPAPPDGPHASESTTVLDGLTVRHCSFQNVQTGVGNGWYFPPVYKERMVNVILEDSWVTGCANGSFAFFDTSNVEVRRWDTWLGGTMFHAGGTTAAFLQDTDNVLIEDSEFAFNLRNQTGNDGVGMDYEGNNTNSTFRHNVVHNNDGGAMIVLPTNANNTNLEIHYNTAWNNARNPATSGQNSEFTASNNSHNGSFTNNGVYLGTDINPPGGLSVYNNTTRWNNLFGANSGGNRTGTPWSAVSGRATTWTFDSSVEGWGNTNDWDGFAWDNETLVGTSSNIDPYVESADTWVNTRESRWVLLRMSNTAGNTGQVFFQTETDPTWTPEKSVTFPIVADGTMQTYIIDFDEVEEYRGVVTKWRLDPTDASGSAMVIEEVSAQVSPFLKSVTAIDYNEVELTFNQAMLPSSGLFDPANYSLTTTTKGTISTNPDTVTQLPTPDGPVFRLKWDAGSMDGSEAVLTVTGVEAARGHAINDDGNSVPFTTIAGPSGIEGWEIF